MSQLRIPAEIRAVFFDKDGTLIDFHAMWAGWETELARRLEQAAGVPVSSRLFEAMGYDPATGRVVPGGPLAVWPMGALRNLTLAVLREALPAPAAEAALASAWLVPDPVALARPLADLGALFGALRRLGLRIAVATTDDRGPTAATLAALGVAPLVEALACGDDGFPTKPAPDPVLALCRQLGVAPAQAMVVGDTTADMRMGRSAGAGLVVGVTSGVSTAELLAPYADVVIGSIGEMLDGDVLKE
jgi:phosphoglycolate phosphatase-like HAD superfamily hydrolase